MTEFYRKGPKGLQSRCKRCNIELSRVYSRAKYRRQALGETFEVSLERARAIIEKENEEASEKGIGEKHERRHP